MLVALLFATSLPQNPVFVVMRPSEQSRTVVKESASGKYRATAKVDIVWHWNMAAETTFTLSEVRQGKFKPVWNLDTDINPTHLWVSKSGHVWALCDGLSGPAQVDTMRVFDPQGKVIADWRIQQLPVPVVSGQPAPVAISPADLLADKAELKESSDSSVVEVRCLSNGRNYAFQLDRRPEGTYHPRDPYVLHD